MGRCICERRLWPDKSYFIAEGDKPKSNGESSADLSESPFQLPMYFSENNGNVVMQKAKDTYHSIRPVLCKRHWVKTRVKEALVYTVILIKSVAVSKLQLAIRARSSREMSQTVRID